MVIKGSAAEHDAERLHPATDVEQEGGKGEKTKGGGKIGCAGARTGENEKGQGGKIEGGAKNKR